MKNKILSIISTLLGIGGFVLLFMGYILTFAQLGNMGVDLKYGVAPGNLFYGLEYSVLFVLLPAILIRVTLGREKSVFHFSDKLIGVMFFLAMIAGTTSAVGKTYNYFIYKDEEVTKIYKDIDIQYQKKFDLVEKLNETTKEYMKYESSTFKSIAEARNTYNSAADLNSKVNAVNSFEKNLSVLLVNVESYPDLKANQAVEKYMDTIIQTENDVVNMRKTYNNSVHDYNTKYKEFPTVMVAKSFGFEPKVYFDIKNEK